jgi:hypothetical protein
MDNDWRCVFAVKTQGIDEIPSETVCFIAGWDHTRPCTMPCNATADEIAHVQQTLQILAAPMGEPIRIPRADGGE